MAGRKVQNTANKASGIAEAIRSVIARHPNIILAYLFGSLVRGKIGPLSDIDVALLLNDDDEDGTIRSNLRSKMAEALGPQRVDVVFLNAALIELAYAVIADGELIYQRDATTRVEYEAKIMSLYCDFLPVLRAQRADILRGGEHESRVQRYRKALGRTERTLSALKGAEG
jgi:predicted nucleotidyltransferase